MSLSPWHRRLLKGARLSHLYLSLFALSLVLFFAATGFMLNHEDWFVSSEVNERVLTGALPATLLVKPDRLAIVELLRRDYGAVGLLDSFEPTDESEMLAASEWRLVFKRPGTEVEALIQRSDGAVASTIRSRGLNAILLDLHRGKSTGKVWASVIDAASIALGLMAATGLVLFSSLKRRGRAGLSLLMLGLIVGAVVAWSCIL